MPTAEIPKQHLSPQDQIFVQQPNPILMYHETQRLIKIKYREFPTLKLSEEVALSVMV
jgi:hypothetical protein